MRPAFFDLVRLLIARSRLEGQLAPALEQDAAPVAALQEALAAWTAWQRYTVQLARAFERLAQGRHATLPPLPPEFHALMAAPRRGGPGRRGGRHPMSACLPWPEVALASLAGGVTLGVSLLPPTPWLAPELHPLTLAVSAGWTAWRLLALDRTWAQRRRWQQAPAWVMEAADLPSETLPNWLPGSGAAAGSCGRGTRPNPARSWAEPFAGTPGIRRSLEQALARDGALPVATDARGGHPAFHAVGEVAEQPLVVPWSEMTGHVLITGTTRSGKTRLLEVLAAEVIRGPGAVVILDPKGDRELLARCAAEAQRASTAPSRCSPRPFPRSRRA